MKIRFLAGAGAVKYSIDGLNINDLDFSEFKDGSALIPSEFLYEKGVFNAFWKQGVLHIELSQPCLPYECYPLNGVHSWEAGEWIDSAEYDSSKCYIIAPNAPLNSFYIKRDLGWTVSIKNIEEPDNKEEEV